MRQENRKSEIQWTQESLRDECICAVCLEPFASPISLYCGHAFDRECLVKGLMQRDQDQPAWMCPICRQTEVPRAIAWQPKNQLLQKITHYLYASEVEHKKLLEREERHEHLFLERQAKYPMKPGTKNARTGSPFLRARSLPLRVGRILTLGVDALYLPWNAVYGPAGVQSEEEVPVSTTLNWSIVAILVFFLLLSLVIDKIVG